MIFITIFENQIRQAKFKNMKTIILNKEFEVKETNGKYFYWSFRAGRWLPVAKAKVIFEK